MYCRAVKQTLTNIHYTGAEQRLLFYCKTNYSILTTRVKKKTDTEMDERILHILILKQRPISSFNRYHILPNPVTTGLFNHKG
jgi:hypothetical protein